VAARVSTPFAGANRIRFEGLRVVRTLSARKRSPVVSGQPTAWLAGAVDPNLGGVLWVVGTTMDGRPPPRSQLVRVGLTGDGIMG
jgi:hypothetical protein